MPREVWGTFSVRDHLSPNAFVADVMLYDRLVIPFPPDDDRERWEEAGWHPDRLDKILTILGDRAYPVMWDEARQANWESRYKAGTELAVEAGDWAFMATRTELTRNLPRYVTGVEAVVTYSSYDELKAELELTEHEVTEGTYGATVAAIVGREFLVPNKADKPYEDLLKEAVELSSDPIMKYNRTDFWRWHREFVDDKGITDQVSVEAAVIDMQDKLRREKEFMHDRRIQTAVQYAYVVATVTLGLLNSPLLPITLGGAFLSVGKYVSGRLGKDVNEPDKAGVALIYDSQKHFGWT